MSTGHEQSQGDCTSAQAAGEAALWDARLRAPDCTEDNHRTFVEWRDAQPANRAAFEQLQSVISVLREERGRPGARALRDSALAMAHRRRRSRLAMAAGIAVAVAAGSLWLAMPEQMSSISRNGVAAIVQGFDSITGSQQERYVTDIGQRTTVTLRDGSIVELNARTEMVVRFDESRRDIELRGGQALFRVAKDASRPFAVHAAGRQILALGTEFDVRLDERSLRVTLLEGKVSVGQGVAGGGDPDRVLRPGEQLLAQLPAAGRRKPAQIASVRRTDVEKVTGWREGRVFVEDLTLREAAQEMNRHSPVQIVVDDPALAALRINGMFRAGEQEVFVAALEDYFPIATHRYGDSSIVLTRKQPE